jgi:ABC-type multidrug transport system fused ATPase/permease subunit
LELTSSINFENLTFSYPETDKKVLDSVNLTIKKNSSVAFIGSSGAGKTTAADVLLGLLEPQIGKVTVDGIDIQENMQAWHNCIGYIPQTIYLMDDSIKANITFGISKEQIDDDRINQVLKEAQLDEFVKSLPEGLDTMVGDRGVRLSGGQRQRIGIARALYRNPQVLILDEATSALDNETEKEVMQAIDGLHGTRTLIVIAHRLSTIAKCDRIYEVGEGKITERNKEDVLGGK